jgi:hypothetical protein
MRVRIPLGAFLVIEALLVAALPLVVRAFGS